MLPRGEKGGNMLRVEEMRILREEGGTGCGH